MLTVRAGRVTINILPDDVLLLVFHFDRVTTLDELGRVGRLLPSWRWDRLVHVCQRWRSVVFASPNFLDLKLFCGPGTRLELTAIWPPLPIVIANTAFQPMPKDFDFDALTMHRNRVCEIDLSDLTSLQLQRMASAMQVQFPALIHLMLHSDGYYGSLVPDPALFDGFLGGSAPHLQSLTLHSIPFPALPKLLLSTTHLVHLALRDIPYSGYISPETIVNSLATLANLDFLAIEFKFRQYHPDRHPSSTTHAVLRLPALTRFEFRGANEYLEDFLARIDAPLLDTILINFFRLFVYAIPQLAQFMGRTTRFQAFNDTHVELDCYGVRVQFLSPTPTTVEKPRLRIFGRNWDCKLASVEQVFTSFFPSIYMVEHLYISRPRFSLLQWQDEDYMEWRIIFHLFKSVKNLYVSKEFVQQILLSLQELLRESVLPALENLFLENLQPSGPDHEDNEAVGQFVAARQLLGHPVAVSHWDGI